MQKFRQEWQKVGRYFDLRNTESKMPKSVKFFIAIAVIAGIVLAGT